MARLLNVISTMVSQGLGASLDSKLAHIAQLVSAKHVCKLL